MTVLNLDAVLSLTALTSKHYRMRLRAALVVGVALQIVTAPGMAFAGPPVPPSPLPPPPGPIVNVSTVAQLQAAVTNISSNATILVAPGTYNLTSTLYVNGTYTNVAIRGASGDRDDVILVGKGMTAAGDGGVPYGIWVGGNVHGITIADLTIRDVYTHPIILNAGTQSPLIRNVRLINAGQQFIKSNPDGSGGGVNDGIVEYSSLEYTTTSRDAYTNGVDVHTGANWIIRNNQFLNIRAPQGQLAGPSIANAKSRWASSKRRQMTTPVVSYGIISSIEAARLAAIQLSSLPTPLELRYCRIPSWCQEAIPARSNIASQAPRMP